MNQLSLQNQLKDFPKKPGVYLMKDQDGRVIYVGKAKILKNRVRSYFTGDKDPKTRVLVSKISAIDVLVTSSEYEALILENNLIKEYNPRYNINLKDGKTYPVIRITNEDYPRIFRTRRIIHDGSRYFGPYPNIKALETYLELVDKIYPLRKCRGPLKQRSSPCLYYHLHKCPGPCANLISQEDYKNQVNQAAELLSQQPKELETDLRSRMEEASQSLAFEKAAEYRDMIRAMDTMFTGQSVVDYNLETRDYLGWHNDQTWFSFVILQMRGGKMVGTDMFRTESYGDVQETLEQFLLRYYSEFNRYPEKLFVPPDLITEEIQRYLSEELSAPTQVLLGSEDRDGAILNMATETARQDNYKQAHDRGNMAALEELQRILKLPTIPLKIEGFDIAQLHGKHTVAAMVSFYQGRPDRKEYRHFGIRSLQGEIDDFESIREAVARRYTRVLNEDLPRPDLILIDGGKGQLNGAKSILDALGLDHIPILGLAKREEEIFLPGSPDPITLPPGHPSLRILQAVRDEAHRFGTSHNQQLRTKDVKLETLEGIPGLGKVRSRRLLLGFGSVEEIAKADVQQLAQVGGFGTDLATLIKQRLTNKEP
jgi:excinuclease ABC subunit C